MEELYSETIKLFRKQQKITQQKLAAMSGVSVAAVCRAEKGRGARTRDKIITAIIRYHHRKRFLDVYAKTYSLLEQDKGEPVYLHCYETKNSLWDKIKRFIRKVLF